MGEGFEAHDVEKKYHGTYVSDAELSDEAKVAHEARVAIWNRYLERSLFEGNVTKRKAVKNFLIRSRVYRKGSLFRIMTYYIYRRSY